MNLYLLERANSLAQIFRDIAHGTAKTLHWVEDENGIGDWEITPSKSLTEATDDLIRALEAMRKSK